MTINPTPAEFLANKSPCREGLDFAIQFDTMADVWDACEQPGWMFWIIRRTTPLTKKQSVQMSVAFSEPRLDCVPEGEDRPRNAIEAANKWLKDPTEENRIAASVAVKAAYCAARAAADFSYAEAAAYAAAGAATAANNVSASDSAAAAYYASTAAVSAAAHAAFDAADTNPTAASDAAADAARRKHCEIIREIVANPFK